MEFAKPQEKVNDSATYFIKKTFWVAHWGKMFFFVDRKLATEKFTKYYLVYYLCIIRGSEILRWVVAALLLVK